MHSLTIAAVQCGLYPKDEKRAISEVVKLVRRAAEMRSARLVCLPEHWLIEKILRGADDPLYGTFQDAARDLDVYINMGGIFEKVGGITYFLSPTVSPEGRVISKQKKVHLFRRETEIAIGGDSFDPFSIDGITTGVMVCHDVVFPESARTLVLKGAEIILNPSLITTRGIRPWRFYLMARALENRVPIIAANPYLRPRVPGISELLGLSYEKPQGIMQVKELARPTTGIKLYVTKISFDEESAALRRERLAERQPTTYYKDPTS
jgi:omega-amidase